MLFTIYPKHAPQIGALGQQIADFYAHSTSYYGGIDFTATAWTFDPVYLDISAALTGSTGKILEVEGCSAANILKSQPHLRGRYAALPSSQPSDISKACRF